MYTGTKSWKVIKIFVFPPQKGASEARRRKNNKQKQIQSRETNVIKFVQLLVLRLVYGIATSMGFGENISEFFGGIFVPPGVEDDDDLDFDY